MDRKHSPAVLHDGYVCVLIVDSALLLSSRAAHPTGVAAGICTHVHHVRVGGVCCVLAAVPVFVIPGFSKTGKCHSLTFFMSGTWYLCSQAYCWLLPSWQQ